MIVVSVGHCHDVDVPQSALPEIGRNHLLSDVHTSNRRSLEAREPAAVNEHRPPIRERDEQAVSLSHVDG